jgi:hypothetical protein
MENIVLGTIYGPVGAEKVASYLHLQPSLRMHGV